MDEIAFPVETGTQNGTTPLPNLDTDIHVWRLIEHGWQEIQRRDGSAEARADRAHREKRWYRWVALLCLGVVVWLYYSRQAVQVMVQTVQIDDRQRIIQVGLPQDLLAYTPEEGQWMDMLGQWVHKFRWRDDASQTTLIRHHWAWVARHTCGQARALLDAEEAKQQPFKPGKMLRSIEVQPILKTAAPNEYQVFWTEVSTDKANPGVKTTQWSGTFAVGRLRPANLTDAMDNRLGLCVTMFDMQPIPPKP